MELWSIGNFIVLRYELMRTGYKTLKFEDIRWSYKDEIERKKKNRGLEVRKKDKE